MLLILVGMARPEWDPAFLIADLWNWGLECQADDATSEKHLESNRHTTWNTIRETATSIRKRASAPCRAYARLLALLPATAAAKLLPCLLAQTDSGRIPAPDVCVCGSSRLPVLPVTTPPINTAELPVPVAHRLQLSAAASRRAPG